MSIHPCIECDDEIRPRQQALQCDDYGRPYGLSDHMIEFCVVHVVCVHVFVRNQEIVSQAYKTSVSKKRLHIKPTTLHFVVRNEQRFKNLCGVVGNKERFSVKNFSTLLPINSLKFWSFQYLFLGATWLFFSGDITKISGNTTQVSGDMTSDEMTLRWLDCKPL